MPASDRRQAPFHQAHSLGRFRVTGDLLVALPSRFLDVLTVVHEVEPPFVADVTGVVSLQVVASTSSAFPAGSLPLYVLVTDSVFRFSSVIDKRPSTAGMQATLEVVADSTLRAGYASSFAFDQVQNAQSGPFNISIGPGKLLVGGQTTTFYGPSRMPGTNGGLLYSVSIAVSGGLGSYPGAIQVYIDSNGYFTSATAIDITGKVIPAGGPTSFPAGSFPLFIAWSGQSSAGHISLEDWRAA